MPKVSVYYPRGVRTGGPEALHQLVHVLREMGRDAKLVPIPGTNTAPRVSEYEVYDAPEARIAADAPGDIVVVPESWLLPRGWHPRADVLHWWLSIDNSPLFAAERLWLTRRIARPNHSKRSLLRARLVEGIARPRRLKAIRGHRHAAQSHYAAEFLMKRMGIVAAPLSDFVAVNQRTHVTSAVATVSYNPAKGGEHIRAVKAALYAANVRWLPLQDLTRTELLDSLAQSDVFLDLGHQPGKDRLPREAALLGAVTLVAQIGAGADLIDTPLPSEHKIRTEGDFARNAAVTLSQVLADPEEHFHRQRYYREGLLRERDAFKKEVRYLFNIGCRS